MTIIKNSWAAILAVLTTIAVVAVLLFVPTQGANATTGSSVADPIVVTNVTDVPAGAVEDNPSTYVTANECDTTRSWVHTKPAVSEVSHQEYRFYRDVPPTYRTDNRSAKKVYTPGKDAKVAVLEYRFPKETRVWVPEVKEVKVYSYKKTVQDFKTRYWFAKYTHTKEKPKNGSWGAYGPWTKWLPETHTSWEWSTTPLGSPQKHGEGTYSNGTRWYREWQAQYTGRSEQVPNGSHDEFSGERTTTLGSPWVLLSGYPKVTTQGVPAHWGDWTPAGYTDWGPSSVKPVDTDTTRYGAVESHEKTAAVPATSGVWGPWTPQLDYLDGWEDVQPKPVTPPVMSGSGTYAPLVWEQTRTVVDVDGYTEYYVSGEPASRNAADASWEKDAVLTGWTQFDERKVVDSAAQPEVRTYYAWTDGKECEVVTPTPTPTVTVTPVPPVVTPTPPVVEPPVKVKKPHAKIRANCTGRVAYSLDNTKSNAKVTFKYLRNGKVTKVTVKAGKSKFFVKKAKARSVAWIKAKGMKTVKTRVPGACHVPHSGYRK
jgi:hypothetical protein